MSLLRGSLVWKSHFWEVRQCPYYRGVFISEVVYSQGSNLFIGSGLRIVGGVKCPHSGEKHAQIIAFKHMEKDPVQDALPLPSFHKGKC